MAMQNVYKDCSVLFYGLSYSDMDMLLIHYDTILRFIDVDIFFGCSNFVIYVPVGGTTLMFCFLL